MEEKEFLEKREELKITKKLERIADDFLKEYNIIKLKEVNVVLSDLQISKKLIKEISKKYKDIYFYSLHQDKEGESHLGSIISEEKLILK
ncbi:hypothetical protein [Fusobacterium ulcerans]|uniref:hypothetical protein n=1 Tax=Fusobacterium ulcerans TaxID=861 RepID=UPI002E77EAB0|nr:hypothetical protein [Fusobacterium ulcerans]MEE0138000.1 hypothetical protein [Fusobacterium ulcerans]